MSVRAISFSLIQIAPTDVGGYTILEKTLDVFGEEEEFVDFRSAGLGCMTGDFRRVGARP